MKISSQKLLDRNARKWNIDGVHTARETFEVSKPGRFFGLKRIDSQEFSRRLEEGLPVTVSRDLEVTYGDDVRVKRRTEESLQSPEQWASFASRFDDEAGPREIYEVRSRETTGWVHPSEYQTANFFDGDADFSITPEEIVGEAAPGKLAYKDDTLVDYQFHRLTRQIPPQVKEYSDYNGYVQSMEELAEKHPGAVEMVPLGSSVGGRTIWALKVGNGPEEALVTGLTHAREWLTGQVALESARSLAENSEMHDKLTAWIVPVHNPDGYELTRTEDPSVRTNGAGVDLNRNYPAEWRLAGDTPESTRDDEGGSDKPGTPSYRGPSALSEPESQAIKGFLQDHPKVGHWLDLHGYGQLLIMSDQAELDSNRAMISRMKEHIPDYKIIGLQDYGATSGTSIQFAKQKGIKAAVMEMGTCFQPAGEDREQSLREGVAATLAFLTQTTE